MEEQRFIPFSLKTAPVLWLGIVFCLLWFPHCLLAGNVSHYPFFELEPARINTGAFYHGQHVTVRALVPAGERLVVICCTGPAQDIHLMEKGQVMGFWMNVKELTLKKFPSLYIMVAKKPLRDSVPEDIQRSYSLGYPFLQAEWDKQFSDISDREKFPDFLKLKEKDMLYQMIIDNDAIVSKAVENGYEEMTAHLWIPPRALPGRYKVTLISLEHGEPLLVEDRSLDVVEVGLPSFLSDFAKKRGLEYGIVAVILATLSGLAIGFIFSTRGSH